MRDRYNRFEVVVRPKGRTPADEYSHRGFVWIEGRENSSYTIDLFNHTPNRVLAVISVDGVGVLDGNPASFDSRGYVINPNQNLSIPGWAVNASQAAEFYFSNKNNSYASQMGQGGTQGVIGAAFFQEVQNPPFDADAYRTMPFYGGVGNNMPLVSKGINPLASAQVSSLSTSMDSNVSDQLGTGFGPAVDWQTTSTSFQKVSSTPCATLVLHYATADALRKMGIQLKSRTIAYSSSAAFPGNNQDYCAPPPSWVLKNKH